MQFLTLVEEAEETESQEEIDRLYSCLDKDASSSSSSESRESEKEKKGKNKKETLCSLCKTYIRRSTFMFNIIQFGNI